MKQIPDELYERILQALDHLDFHVSMSIVGEDNWIKPLIEEVEKYK